ncbi:MAG: hypothetical protein WBH50_24000 [Fuerstiella sp.]
MERNNNFDADWFVFQRLQDVAAARRINLIRMVAVLMFFALVVWDVYSSDLPTSEQMAHLKSVTRICAAWMLLAAAVFTSLMMKVFPPIINYLTTIGDVLLLTAVAALGLGAAGNLILGYFLIVAASFLRFSLPLIVFTWLLSIFGYLILVYNTTSFRIRPDDVEFPYFEMLRVICGLCVMAIIGWQLCSGGKAALHASIEANLAESDQ